MKNLVLIVFLISAGLLNAQQYPFWEHYELPKNQKQSDYNHPDEIYYYTKFLTAVEYEYDYTYNQYYKYYTEHYRVKLQTDLAIEEFNKVYISLEDVVAVKRVEARIIKEDKVVELKPEIEEFFSDDESEQYQYFPVSGLELGDELEIVYTVKMEPEYDGDQHYFQGEIPIYDFDFYLISGIDSKFAFKAHNGFKEPEKIDTILHRNQWYCHMDTIPAVRSEYFSEYANNIMKLDVALTAVVSGTEEDYSPFQNFADLLNWVYNVPQSSKVIKKVHALNDRIGVNNTRNTRERIRLIEDYMKTEFNMYGANPGDDFADMIENEKGGVVDAILLYMCMFDDAGIAYEYGFITNRYETTFEDDIESQFFMQNYFFFFPDVKEYLAPIDFSSRMGYLDAEWIPNNAFHVTQLTYPRTSSFEVKPVPAVEAKDNTDSTVIHIKLADNMLDVEISVERYLMGYKAGESQLYYQIYREQRQKEVEQDLLNFLNDRSQYKLSTLENISPEVAFLKPIIAKGTVTDLATPLIEKAGDLTIFKLGEIFGEYVSLDEIRKKQFDFVFSKASFNSTTIHLELPEGVEVQNPESIEVADNISSEDNVIIRPSLTIKGNMVTYELKERWFDTRYSIDQKEDLMKVFAFYANLSKMNLILK